MKSLAKRKKKKEEEGSERKNRERAFAYYGESPETKSSDVMVIWKVKDAEYSYLFIQ